MSSWVDFLVPDYIVGSEAWGSVANSVSHSVVAVDNAVAVDDAVADAVAVVDGNSVELLVILGDM